MFRCVLLLCALPAAAMAEWSPTPYAFSYDAAFARCTADPARIGVTECRDFLNGAYVLNRAVVNAVTACDTATLSACPVAFEDQGLPAIAARIAEDAACEAKPTDQLPALTPLPNDHCITMISDILRDEGVVPFDTDITCTGPQAECVALQEVHSLLWIDAITALSDSDLTKMRLETSFLTCYGTRSSRDTVGDCYLAALADIWADLAQATAGDN